MKKISIVSAFLGTLIEVYDFSVFAFLIPILSEVFFSSSASSAINFTILAYVISYAVKPLGAVAFGFLMDAYGRKKVLLITTLFMTVATAMIGLLPIDISNTYQWWILIVCRLIQGLSISGEFSSAIIMSVEQGQKRPGFLGSMAFIGGSLGLLFANLSTYVLLNIIPHNQMVIYGWRIPFLISTILWLVLFLIRKGMDDIVPVKSSIEHDIRELISKHKSALFRVFVISSLSASAFYMTFVFMPTFLSTSLHVYTHQSAIFITLICLLTYVLVLPLSGLLADVIGVVKQIKIATVLYLSFAYVCFNSIHNSNFIECLFILLFFTMVQALLNSALPAFMVLQFDQMQRGKALAISYNISLTLFGGLMPYLILTNGMHLNPGIPISICAALTLMTLRLNRVK